MSPRRPQEAKHEPQEAQQRNQQGTQKGTQTGLVASLPRSLDAPRVISIQATCLEPLLGSKISPQARGSRLTVHC